MAGRCLVTALSLLAAFVDCRAADTTCDLSVTPTAATVKVGSDVTFLCSATCLGGLSRDQLLWIDNRIQRVSSSGAERVHAVNYNRWSVSRLLVRRAQVSDSGVYTCEIQHGRRLLQQFVRLYVQDDTPAASEDQGPTRGDIRAIFFPPVRPEREAREQQAVVAAASSVSLLHEDRAGEGRAFRKRKSSWRRRRQVSDPSPATLLPTGHSPDANASTSTASPNSANASSTISSDSQSSTNAASTISSHSQNSTNAASTISSDSQNYLNGNSSSSSTLPVDSMKTSATGVPLSGPMENSSSSTDSAVATPATGMSPSPGSSNTTGLQSLGVSNPTGSAADVNATAKVLAESTTAQAHARSSAVDSSTTPASPGSSPTQNGSTVDLASFPPTASSSTPTPWPTTPKDTPFTTTARPFTVMPSTSSTTTPAASSGNAGKVEHVDANTGAEQESDFGRYGLLAFGLTLGIAFLLLYALLLVVLVPRCCKKKGKHTLNADAFDERGGTQRGGDRNDVILLGERPHKPVAPLTSATGLNGEFITAVDLEEEKKDHGKRDKPSEEEHQGTKSDVTAGGQDRGRQEVKMGDTKSKPDTFVSTFMVGRLSLSNQGSSSSSQPNSPTSPDVTSGQPHNLAALKPVPDVSAGAGDDVMITSTPAVSDDDDAGRVKTTQGEPEARHADSSIDEDEGEESSVSSSDTELPPDRLPLPQGEEGRESFSLMPDIQLTFASPVKPTDV